MQGTKTGACMQIQESMKGGRGEGTVCIISRGFGGMLAVETLVPCESFWCNPRL